jgi:hypothetical protein
MAAPRASLYVITGIYVRVDKWAPSGGMWGVTSGG